MKKLFIASHNQGKLAELEALFAPLDIEIQSSKDISYPEPVEDGTTFEENAIIKAKAGLKASGTATIADDSGICVEALGGEPGVYSARYKGLYNTVLEKLTGNDNRKAYFVCVIALALPDGSIELFRGESHGTIASEARGEGGFGYDPVFIPAGESCAYAEMTKEEKAKTSHRKQALTKLLAFLSHG